MNVRAIFIFLLLVTGGICAEPEIEFSGVLAAGGETKVTLTNKTTGESKWVKLGQDFGGYVVASYDASTEAVVLKKGAQQLQLKLKSSSKVKAGSAADPSPEIKRAILNNLRQLAAASDQFYLEHGVDHTTYDELVGPEKYVKKIDVQDGENYRQLVFKQGMPLIVTTAGGYTTTYAP